MITVINQSKKVINQTDIDVFTELLEQYRALVKTYWTEDVTVLEYKIIIVDKFPNPTMQRNLGYHEVVSGQPVAYVRVDAYGSRIIFGTYGKSFSFKGRQIHGERFTRGLLAVAAHELAEMIVDPFINKVSIPDSLGRQWVMEICDHTVGNFRRVVGGHSGILPDFTFPSFYGKGNYVSPYSYLDVPIKPLTLVKGAYGYYKDKFGIHKI